MIKETVLFENDTIRVVQKPKLDDRLQDFLDKYGIVEYHDENYDVEAFEDLLTEKFAINPRMWEYIKASRFKHTDSYYPVDVYQACRDLRELLNDLK